MSKAFDVLMKKAAASGVYDADVTLTLSVRVAVDGDHSDPAAALSAAIEDAIRSMGFGTASAYIEDLVGEESEVVLESFDVVDVEVGSVLEG